MSYGSKKNKDYVISARYTEDQYLDILMKITDIDGHQMMSPGAFSKAATLGGKVTIVDTELDRYRTFIASRISNNINQIARGLNADREDGNISELTYEQTLIELQRLVIELNYLLAPLR